MNPLMRKRIALLLCACLSLGAAGCGTKNGTSDQAGGAQTAETIGGGGFPADSAAETEQAEEPAAEETEEDGSTVEIGGRTYRLSFEDEFDGDSLDTKKWSLCPEWKRQDVGGYWKDSETSVHDGELWLRARIGEDGTPVSGAVRTMGKFEQAYGYFECRMMFPSTTGFWGAFWMMCGDVGMEDGTAISGAEVDIIETGECARKGVNHAIHWDGYGANHKSVSKVIPKVPDLYEGWHTYGFEWTKDAYIFYIDGEETWRTSEPGICEKPGYMKLTTEFGSWAAPIVPEDLPDYCRVDWVRAYESAGD